MRASSEAASGSKVVGVSFVPGLVCSIVRRGIKNSFWRVRVVSLLIKWRVILVFFKSRLCCFNFCF